MKHLYWRPRGVSTNALLIIAAIAVSSLTLVESFPERSGERDLQQMLDAASLSKEAIRVLRAERERRKILLDPIADPAGSGLIGVAMSEVTSNKGNLLAKQTTINPNWAAVAVALLQEAGVREGDTVAVGLSGSFPGLNVSIYAAIATLRLEPIIISSVSSSQWGANHKRFLWLDMEKALNQQKLVSFRSAAASFGGAEDRATELSEEGLGLLRKAVARSRLPLIEPESYAESVAERMAIYRDVAAGKPIRAYINIGGGNVLSRHPSLQVRVPTRRQPPNTSQGRTHRFGDGALSRQGHSSCPLPASRSHGTKIRTSTESSGDTTGRQWPHLPPAPLQPMARRWGSCDRRRRPLLLHSVRSRSDGPRVDSARGRSVGTVALTGTRFRWEFDHPRAALASHRSGARQDAPQSVAAAE